MKRTIGDPREITVDEEVDVLHKIQRRLCDYCYYAEGMTDISAAVFKSKEPTAKQAAL